MVNRVRRSSVCHVRATLRCELFRNVIDAKAAEKRARTIELRLPGRLRALHWEVVLLFPSGTGNSHMRLRPKRRDRGVH